MFWKKLSWNPESNKQKRLLEKAKKVEEIAKLMSSSVEELLWNNATKKQEAKSNSKKIIITLSIASLVWIGWVIYTKYEDIKWRIDAIFKIAAVTKPIYKVYETESIPWIHQTEWYIYVMYTLKEWEKIIAKRKYSNYFLDCKVYETSTPDWDTIYVYVSRDEFNKEDLPRWSIIEWVIIKIVKNENKNKGVQKYFFK